MIRFAIKQSLQASESGHLVLNIVNVITRTIYTFISSSECFLIHYIKKISQLQIKQTQHHTAQVTTTYNKHILFITHIYIYTENIIIVT